MAKLRILRSESLSALTGRCLLWKRIGGECTQTRLSRDGHIREDEKKHYVKRW